MKFKYETDKREVIFKFIYHIAYLVKESNDEEIENLWNGKTSISIQMKKPKDMNHKDIDLKEDFIRFQMQRMPTSLKVENEEI